MQNIPEAPKDLPENTKSNIRTIDRDITKLALPALGTLLVQPLLVLVDSTMIGRIGTAELAGLSLASTILSTVIGLCIFLSYATTATTAHFVGAGKIDTALRSGIDGIWIAILLGVLLGVGMNLFSEQIIELFSPSSEILTHGSQYLVASSFGIPGMLLVLAATGTIRGFADTKTPLYIATFGALLNIPLNIVLIYGADLGVYGAGLGTAIAETLMGLLLVGKILQLRKNNNSEFPTSLLPTGAGLLRSLKDAFPLFLRTVSLRGAL
ncbi:MAG: MATE family efflux transporter, partial [Arcanobacterium sp.]|nr:MATE family efflux transporter [Arcanobacterium sp.]